MEKEKGSGRKSWGAYGVPAILFAAFIYPCAWILVRLAFFFYVVFAEGEFPDEGPLALYALALSAIVGLAIFIRECRKTDKQRSIAAQFQTDQTSVCPQCGSEDIKIYPKGYNSKLGFWGTLLGFKAAPVFAALDSDKVCCRCRSCGNKWETPYAYREVE